LQLLKDPLFSIIIGGSAKPLRLNGYPHVYTNENLTAIQATWVSLQGSRVFQPETGKLLANTSKSPKGNFAALGIQRVPKIIPVIGIHMRIII
jgi:hypothetical protein